MCSSVSSRSSGRIASAPADVAAQLARAIDDYAAALHSGGAADPGVAGQLAALWAMLTDADPELAARVARYAGS